MAYWSGDRDVRIVCDACLRTNPEHPITHEVQPPGGCTYGWYQDGGVPPGWTGCRVFARDGTSRAVAFCPAHAGQAEQFRSLLDRMCAVDDPEQVGALEAEAIGAAVLESERIETKERNEKAIEIAVRYGGIDGANHKAWVIDQMVRALAGDEYDTIVAEACDGEDGPETYTWDEGTPP